MNNYIENKEAQAMSLTEKNNQETIIEGNSSGMTTTSSLPENPPAETTPAVPTAMGTPPAVPTMGMPPAVPTMGMPPAVPTMGMPPAVPTMGTPPAVPTMGTPPAVPTMGTPPAALALNPFANAKTPIRIAVMNIAKQAPDWATLADTDQFCEKATDFYIRIHDTFPDEETCVIELLTMIKCEIEEANKVRPKEYRLKSPDKLPCFCIAKLIAARGDVALVASSKNYCKKYNISLSDDKMDSLPTAMYQDSGYNKGVWEIFFKKSRLWRKLVKRYYKNAKKKDVEEIYDLTRDELQVVWRCDIPYYVPVNNVIVDVENHKPIAFNKALVFTNKIHTDLNISVQVPDLRSEGFDGDLEEWFRSLGPNEFVSLIWEVIQAACLPLAPREKMVLFYSPTGNNGKGTICQLIRNIIGNDATVSIQLNEFSAKFGLSSLPDAVAVITDENDVNSFNKGLANLKAALTGDPVSVERKFEGKFDCVFTGLVLQCINELPKMDDKTGSMNRRLHIIPFSNCFTGKQNKRIKSETIRRQDVCEYVLKKVLMDMEYKDSFTESPLTQNALKEFVSSTNSVVEFLEEILPQCVWNLIPVKDFLYEAYKPWYKQSRPSGRVLGRNEFLGSVRSCVATDPGISQEWEWKDSARSKGYIDCSVPEPLLHEYNLTAFMDDFPLPGSMNRSMPCQKKIKEKYSSCLRRRVTAPGTNVQGTNVQGTNVPDTNVPDTEPT